MIDTITVRGYIATDVRLTVAQSGLPIAGFRMCSTERRFDKETNAWVDGHTNWYSVSMFRQLATNAGASIKKGDRVVITGRLRVRPWINADGRTGTSVEIDAETAGHDLMWGTASFRRTAPDRAATDTAPAPDDLSGTGLEDGLPNGIDGVTGEFFDGPSGGVDDAVTEVDGDAGGGTNSRTAREEAVPF